MQSSCWQNGLEKPSIVQDRCLLVHTVPHLKWRDTFLLFTEAVVPNSWRSESCSWPVMKGLAASSCRASQHACQVAKWCHCVHAGCQVQLLPSDEGPGSQFAAHITGAEPVYRGCHCVPAACQHIMQAPDLHASQARLHQAAQQCRCLPAACQERLPCAGRFYFTLPAGRQKPSCRGASTSLSLPCCRPDDQASCVKSREQIPGAGTLLLLLCTHQCCPLVPALKLPGTRPASMPQSCLNTYPCSAKT